MNLRLPGTRTPLPEVKIESDGRNMDTIQDHHEIRGNDELRGGGEEVQMELVDPAPNPQEDPVVRKQTRVVKPSTTYPTTDFDVESLISWEEGGGKRR